MDAGERGALAVRGIRGATTVSANRPDQVMNATAELLRAVFEANQIVSEQIASVFFSVTSDIDSVFPAKAAREMGLTQTALFCCQEAEIRDGLEKCIRLLIHYNTTKPQSEMKHVYLRGASILRPDL